jgi:tRNA-dihydrouridine synthase B
LPFRLLCREQGAAVACTEMVSARGLVYETRSGGRGKALPSRALLLSTPLPGLRAESDVPLVVQLFGGEPFFLGEAVALLRSWGYAYFDLNLGCPVPKVVKSGAGAALARNAALALEAARAMLEAAGPGRVGFKFRLGWNREEENYLELGEALAGSGASWLTLHPRYARQGFSGRADWGALARLKSAVKAPVLASGDLFTAEDAVRCLRESGADGLMFARGALYNPAVFGEFKAAWSRGPAEVAGEGAGEGSREERRPDVSRLKRLVLRHAELVRAVPGKESRGGPDPRLLKMRGAVQLYVRDFPGSRAFRQDLGFCRDWDNFYQLTDDCFAGN